MDHKILTKINNNLLKNSVMKEDPLTSFQCFVCEHLHEGTLIRENNLKDRRNIHNCPKDGVSNKTTWPQHWEIGQCQSKALNILLAENKPFSNEYFETKWKQLLLERSC